jgi:hypothetical protein
MTDEEVLALWNEDIEASDQLMQEYEHVAVEARGTVRSAFPREFDAPRAGSSRTDTPAVPRSKKAKQT